MNRKKIIIMCVLLALIVVGLLSMYTLKETQQALITQFGKPIGEPITEAGLHFKAFYQSVIKMEKRILEWDGAPDNFPTKDKRNIWVDSFARWRVVDVLKYYQRVGGIEVMAQAQLDNILDGSTRNAVSNHLLVEIVRSTNRTPQMSADGVINLNSEIYIHITTGQDSINKEILQNAKQKTLEYGIELVDIRIKRVIYIEKNLKDTYERMVSERKVVSQSYVSAGEAAKKVIEGQQERELKKIESGAYKTSQQIYGAADSLATVIYANAYNQSADTREFYQFLKTLEVYKNVFTQEDWLMLSQEQRDEFLKFLQSPQ